MQLESKVPEYLEVDSNSVSNLQKLIQIKTVSYDDQKEIDPLAFLEFESFIDSLYPLIYEKCDVVKFHKNSFLISYEGRNKDLKPIILMAHYDVVPVPEENRKDWRVDPFAGEIIDDMLYGRGAVDNKFAVISLLEALNSLLLDNYKPERTVKVLFTHDEEIRGMGAQSIAAYLENSGIEAEYLLDEGFMITEGIIPGYDGKLAMIGTAEKGYATFYLTVNADGGHSAIPARETANDILVEAIHNLNANDFEAKITEPVRDFISILGPEMPFMEKFVFANQNILSPLIESIYMKSNSGAAMVQTTLAPTILKSGFKENVVPKKAMATINLRILPGHSIESIRMHIRDVINDERVLISQSKTFAEASPVSSIDTDAYRKINQTIRNLYPDVIVAANLVVGATDARYFYKVTDKIYHFTPFHLTKESMSGFHGVNERVAVEDLSKSIQFYMTLMKN